MNIEMPFVNGRPSGPSGVWGNAEDGSFACIVQKRPVPTTPVTIIPRRANTLTVMTSRHSSDLDLSRTPSPGCPTPMTPELVQFDRSERPRSTSSISTIMVPSTPTGASDEGHDMAAITSALKEMPLPTKMHFAAFGLDDSDDDEDADIFHDCTVSDLKVYEEPVSPVSSSTVRLVARSTFASAAVSPAPAHMGSNSDECSSLPTTPTRRGTPPIIPPRSPSRESVSAPKIVLHGNVAARKITTPVVPAAASSMVGKKGFATQTAYRNLINDIDNDEFGSYTMASSSVDVSPKTPVRNATVPSTPPSPCTPTTPRARAANRVSFALPLFAISERSENAQIQSPAQQQASVATLSRSPSMLLPQPRRASSGPPADDTTVNRWPWGARRVTPIPADVAAAVRVRGSM